MINRNIPPVAVTYRTLALSDNQLEGAAHEVQETLESFQELIGAPVDQG